MKGGASIKPGRPKRGHDTAGLITVPVKMPASMVEEIDRRAGNRSAFVRATVAKEIARDPLSSWARAWKEARGE